jgi:hypothetical protein
MNTQQLIHLAVQVRNQNGGQYRNKSLCQACLMKKAGITAPEDQMEFETVWVQWTLEKMAKDGTCIVYGEEKEVMTLPATQ